MVVCRETAATLYPVPPLSPPLVPSLNVRGFSHRWMDKFMHDQILSMFTGNSWPSITPTGKYIRKTGREDIWRKPEDTLEEGSRSFSREIMGSWVPHSRSKMKRPNSRVGSNPRSHRQHMLWHENVWGKTRRGPAYTVLTRTALGQV